MTAHLNQNKYTMGANDNATLNVRHDGGRWVTCTVLDVDPAPVGRGTLLVAGENDVDERLREYVWLNIAAVLLSILWMDILKRVGSGMRR